MQSLSLRGVHRPPTIERNRDRRLRPEFVVAVIVGITLPAMLGTNTIAAFRYRTLGGSPIARKVYSRERFFDRFSSLVIGLKSKYSPGSPFPCARGIISDTTSSKHVRVTVDENLRTRKKEAPSFCTRISFPSQTQTSIYIYIARCCVPRISHSSEDPGAFPLRVNLRMATSLLQWVPRPGRRTLP